MRASLLGALSKVRSTSARARLCTHISKPLLFLTSASGAEPLPEPDLVLELEDDLGSAGDASRWAFHGTSSENVHSILTTGIKNLSGTRKERNGAIHGDGIYLSKSCDVALSFAAAQPTWSHSRLFSALAGFRAVFACEVPLESRGAGDADPAKYIIVDHESHVRIRYLLLFREGKGASGGGMGWAESGAAPRVHVSGHAPNAHSWLSSLLSSHGVYMIYGIIILAIWYNKH